MSTASRESLAERLHEMKRQAFPRCSMERLGMEVVPNEDATWLDVIELFSDREQIDLYLRAFLAPDDKNRCPCCHARSLFGWGIAHGSGSCACGWPGTLLHYVHDRRDDADIVCAATINGHRVCEAPRGEHVPFEQVWTQAGGGRRIEVKLRCPTPIQPPGLTRPVAPDFRPPEILRMTRLLWAHPYAVHAT